MDLKPTIETMFWFAHYDTFDILHFGYTEVGQTTTANEVAYEFVTNQGQIISKIAKHKDMLYEPLPGDDRKAEPGFYRYDSQGADEIVWLTEADCVGMPDLFTAVQTKALE